MGLSQIFCAMQTFKQGIDLFLFFYSTSIKEGKPEIPLKTLKIKHLNSCNRKALIHSADILRDLCTERSLPHLLTSCRYFFLSSHY